MKNPLFAWIGIGGKSLRVQLAEKDAEIQELKRHLANARKDNSEMSLENRKLRIESAEMRAAYNSLKEILNKRAEAAEAVPHQAAGAPGAGIGADGEPEERSIASVEAEAARNAVSEMVAVFRAAVNPKT